MGLSLIIGVIVGIAMTLFLIFLFLLTRLMLFIAFGIPLLSMLVGGLLLLLALHLGWDRSDDNGISHAITLKHQGQSVSLTTGIKKFFTAGLSIASGLPVGREAPALLLGSGIASKLSHAFHVEKEEIHNAMTLGGAAATGALFQAPFGGAVFAAEVPYKEDADEPMIMPAFVASVSGAVTLSTLVAFLSQWLILDVEIFELGAVEFKISVYTTILAALLGLLSGLVGRGFVKLYQLFDNRLQGGSPSLKFLLAGLSISLSSIIIATLAYKDDYLGEGNTPLVTTLSILNVGNYIIPVILLTLLLQMVATAALLGAGFQGGIFGPALRLGILTGLFFGLVTGNTQIEQLTSWAIIGMSGVHAATTKTPIASILLILEITLFPPLVIPMILANVMAYVISGSDSLYTGQVRSRDSNLMRELSSFDQNESFTVDEIMTTEVITASPTISVAEMRELIVESSKRDFPVVENQHVIGMISIEDISRLSSDSNDELISQYVNHDFLSLDRKMVGRDALQRMLEADVERAVVTDSNNILEGIVSINDIVRGHKKLYDMKRIQS